MKKQIRAKSINSRSSDNVVQESSSNDILQFQNKQNSQYHLNDLQTHPKYFHNEQNHPLYPTITSAHDQYFTIKKPSPGVRLSEYHGHKNQMIRNLKYCRFSQHADRIRSTNPSLNSSQQFSSTMNHINHPLTFATIRQSIRNPSMMKKPKEQSLKTNQEKCFNHFNKQAKFYLLLAEKQHDGTSNKLYYCDKCGINIKQQGFTIHPISESHLQSPLFLQKLNECIKKIQANILDLSKNPYLQQIDWKANEVSKKYDNIIQMLFQFKKQELLQIEKYKFQVFEYVTRRQKQLEGTLKKLELLNESYLKNCDFEETKQDENQHELYWNILQKEKQNLNININSQIRKIKLDDSRFLDELEICQKLVVTFKERVYQLSFEEDSDEVKVYEEKKNSNLLDGFNATFGEKQVEAMSFYE